MVRGTREDTKNQPGLDAAAAEDGATAEDGACDEDASNETAAADPENSAEALRESFCMTEASRTFNLAVQQEADEKGALAVMNDAGVIRMVEPLVTSLDADPSSPGTMGNGGNTCYISAVIFALFARLDAWDALLVRQLQTGQATVMQDLLRESIVNPLRRSEEVDGQVMAHFRYLLQPLGWEADGRREQQDASEFLMFLLEVLEAPLLPAIETLFHGGKEDKDDERQAMERLVQVALPEQVQRSAFRALFTEEKPVALDKVLWAHFFENRVNVSRQVSGDGEEPVGVQGLMMQRLNSWFEGGSEGVSAVILPIMIKRFKYEGNEMQRINRAVEIPELADFSDFIAGSSSATFKLRLRSVVCHSGSSVHRGHYTAITAPVPLRRVGATSHQWLHFDDMHAAGLQTCSDPMGFDRVNMQSDSYLVFYELEKGVGGLTDFEYAMQLQQQELDHGRTAAIARGSIKQDDSECNVQ